MPKQEENALTRETLRRYGVYSDETGQFRTPAEPSAADTVRLSVRVARGTVSAVYCCTETAAFPMRETETEGLFCYYEAEVPPAAAEMRYHFRLEDGADTAYYTKHGLTEALPQDGWFTLLRDFHTPDWAKGAVMYQIYPDRFCNGDKTNDVRTGEYLYLGRMAEGVADWDALPEHVDFNRFYGGDLQGIIDKLDYLRDLGIEVLYCNPLFVSPSNHKYDAQDYDHIDPHLGKIVRDGGKTLEEDDTDNTGATMYAERTTRAENLTASDELFAELVEQAHARGIRVLVDGVFNHCGAFHKWMDRESFYRSVEEGAFFFPESPYHSYFYWNADGSYEGWWGHQNHPKLNLEGCAALREEILRIGQKWVSPPFCADGWRLDVAADLGKTLAFNHSFWREFRRAVKAVSPEKLILAEHYGDATAWLAGDQWDSVMNYDAFMEPVTWFLTGVSKHSTEQREDLYNNAEVFWNTMRYHMDRLPMQALQTAMNELSNHDHSRFLTRTNRRVGRLETAGSAAAAEGIDPAVMRMAVLLQMTWVGAPTVYYGDEAGLVGWTDPDNRRTYPWGREDAQMLAFHRKAIALRKENPVLRNGSLKPLYGAYGVIAYGRFDRRQRCVILLNNTEEGQEVLLPVWQLGTAENGVLEQLLATDRDGMTDAPQRAAITGGMARLLAPPKSAMVWREVER